MVEVIEEKWYRNGRVTVLEGGGRKISLVTTKIGWLRGYDTVFSNGLPGAGPFESFAKIVWSRSLDKDDIVMLWHSIIQDSLESTDEPDEELHRLFERIQHEEAVGTVFSLEQRSNQDG